MPVFAVQGTVSTQAAQATGLPAGIPVACVAIGNAGARNAAYLAAEILGLKYDNIQNSYDKYRNDLRGDK